MKTVNQNGGQRQGKIVAAKRIIALMNLNELDELFRLVWKRGDMLFQRGHRRAGSAVLTQTTTVDHGSERNPGLPF